jgi:hypothetical protein
MSTASWKNLVCSEGFMEFIDWCNKLRKFCMQILFRIKVDIKELGCEGEDWLYLAWSRGQWNTFVNTWTLEFCKRQGIFLPAE